MLRSTIAAAAAVFLARCAPAAASPVPATATVPALGSYLAAHGSSVAAHEFSDQRRYYRHRSHRHRYRHCWNQRVRVRTPIGAFTYRTVRRCAWRYR
jgi:hypothetical protein